VAVVIAIIVAAQNLFWWFHLTHLVIIAGLVAVLVYLLRGRAGRPDGGDDPPRQP
jgi:membrane protein implicated in regulation of membrane protease activity